MRTNEEDALISRQFAETQMHERIAICNPDEGHGLEKSGGDAPTHRDDSE